MSKQPNATNGLARKFKEIHRRAEEQREKGELLTFRGAVQSFLREQQAQGKPYTEREYEFGPELIFQEAGINPGLVTLRELLTTPAFADVKYIVPEVILDAINQGVLNDPWHNDFVVASKQISGRSDNVPLYPRNTKKKVKKSSEAAAPFRSTLQFGEKEVKSYKYMHAFDATYEAIFSSTIDMVALHFRLATDNISMLRRAQLLNALVSGEQADGSEAIATIGVKSTATGFQYADYLRGWVRQTSMNIMPTSLLCTEDNVLDLLEWDEFKKRSSGTTDLTLRMRQPLPTDVSVYTDDSIGANYFVLVDRTKAIAEVRKQAPMVESERIIQQQIVDTVWSEDFGYYTLLPVARLRFDQSKEYSSNKFPSWFAQNAYA